MLPKTLKSADFHVDDLIKVMVLLLIKPTIQRHCNYLIKFSLKKVQRKKLENNLYLAIYNYMC